ncbi:afadin/alpha-actinin-binding family protein [Rhodotorula toruloides]|uniref:Centrosomal protein of 70 kDa n=1 Tax=Rhodotorula toruloides TaxID=5286 RepID=A0A511KCD3_RHOTO|nr:afadin/alpha-actinin-binding family protein [Rhodotorula toruloides]
MDIQSLLNANSTEDSLSALSTQLVSLGYLSRPLDLSTLFLAPPIPSNATAKALKKYHDLLILQARAREQIAKCLWGMLEQRQAERGTIEALLSREASAAEEAEREKNAADRARKEREVLGKELEAEKARAKDVEQKLKLERERHRHAREELAKAKNALQFVKTQAQHDLKRREAEVQSLHQRLQKLTTAPTSSASDSAFTRFVVLNGAAGTSASSPITATFGGRGSRLPARSPTATSAPPSSAAAALEAELDLLRTTLDDRLSECEHLADENKDLRTFVGEVEEWAEGVLETDEMLKLRKAGEEGEEIRGVLETGDESFHIPSPYLGLPIPILTSSLHRKLYAIRLGLLSLNSTTSSAVSTLREELEGEIERLNEEIEEEVRRREETEKEREEAKEQVRMGERLVQEWADKAHEEKRRRLTRAPESDDELPLEIEASIAIEKQKRQARKASTRAPPPVASVPVTDAPAKAASAPRPSAPSVHVTAFLSDLGLDTPVVEESKGALKSEKVRNGTSQELAADKARVRSSGEQRTEKERAVDAEMPPPTKPTRRTSFSRSPTFAPGIPSSRSASAMSTISSGASSALDNILALATSPPVSSEPLVSTKAAGSAKDKERSRSILASSRLVNADVGQALDGETEQDRVAAKKQALLERARSASAYAKR